MNSLKLMLIFTLMSLSITSFARKPAVEDFVGVESEDYRATVKGTEVVFNFGNHLYQDQRVDTTKDAAISSEVFSIVGLISFITLPFLLFFGITKLTPQARVVDNFEEATSDVGAEIFDLQSAKREKEEDIKKAS